MTLEKDKEPALEFPIELRHPDGGSMLFNDLHTIIDCFYIKGLTHEGITMHPADFGLFVNGREYQWDPKCKPEDVDMGNLLEETIKHLKYVVDIERSFYDAVNIPHEEDIPTTSVRGKAPRRRTRR